MQIVFGTDVFYPLLEGGGEVHTFNVAKNLVKFGHEVTVISGKSSQFPNDPIDRLKRLKNEEVVEGIHIIRAKKPYKFGSTLSSLPALYEMYNIVRSMIRENKAEVVNFVLYRPCIPFFLAARGNVPTILTVHLLSEGFGNWRGWRDYDGGLVGGLTQKLIEEIVLRFPYDQIITVSKTLFNRLCKYYLKEKIKVVYNGVDLETYDKVEVKEKKLNQLIFVGALKKRKNVLDAIKATKIAREQIGRKLKLLIISGGGELEEEVLRMKEKYGFIEYYKKANDETKIRLLKESSLLVFPTSKEGFPLVPIEALACNTPFLGYNIPEMKEVEEATSGGVLVPYKNIQMLAEKICELVENEILLRKLGNIGRKNVERKFTWVEIARREENVFKEVLNK
jgi:glycosyltransferase involved in cell wall biosynthesis